MRWIGVLALVALSGCASPYYTARMRAAYPASSWCGGQYDRARGSNFGPCAGYVSPAKGSIQSPGDSPAGDSGGPGSSSGGHGGHGK